MCTVSIVSSPDGAVLRVLMNRDERRLRPVAQPPSVHQVGTSRAIWPTDPEGGGTWIAATDAGMVLLVMNVDGSRRRPEFLSRGLLIPTLADAGSVDELHRRWRRLDVTAFAPFRLVAVTREALAVFTPTRAEARVSSIGGAHLFASSSLGDEEAESTRGELFARLLRSEIDPWTAQTRFHQHAWPDRRHLSVMMSRVDACTVSQTEVVLTNVTASLAYRPVVDGWPVTATHRALAVQGFASVAA
jgi:hypothetical protein